MQKNNRFKQGLLALAVSLTLAAPATSWAEIIHGQVVSISNGDTLTVLDEHKVEHRIRLSGIDAPEKAQAFGQRSKEHLSELVFGKIVDVGWMKTDKYGRTIGKVLVNGQDANLAQVEAGLAWHYKAYEKEQPAADRVSYANAEINARSRRSGLWADSNPVPPWDFRHGTGDAQRNSEWHEKSEPPCPCGGKDQCSGQKGGVYCMTETGKRKYF